MNILSPAFYAMGVFSITPLRKKTKIVFAVFCAVVLAAIAVLGLTPVFIIETGQGIYQWTYAGEGKEFSLNFIHSVQLTPVTENFVITGRKTFKLQSTEYQSFGVGLPFLREDGVFCQEGDKFVMKGMDREFKTIELMIYPDNKLTFICEGKADYLYQELPYASLVRLKVEAFGVYFIKKYFES